MGTSVPSCGYLKTVQKEKNIYNALFGLSRRHCKKSNIWPLTSVWPAPWPRFSKKITCFRESSRQRLSNAVCRLSLRCVVLEISGGQNVPPPANGARWSADPNGARVNLTQVILLTYYLHHISYRRMGWSRCYWTIITYEAPLIFRCGTTYLSPSCTARVLLFLSTFFFNVARANSGC